MPEIATVAVAGVTAMDDNAAALTVTVVVAVLPLNVPVINEEPAAMPVVKPVVALTVTAAGVAEV